MSKNTFYILRFAAELLLFAPCIGWCSSAQCSIKLSTADYLICRDKDLQQQAEAVEKIYREKSEKLNEIDR